MNQNRIKEELEKQGRTKIWLSKQLNIHQSSIYKYCSNEMQPDIFRLKKIADLLNVSIEDLLCIK